jgi:hypothetical protein
VKTITTWIFICNKPVNNDTKSNSYSPKRTQYQNEHEILWITCTNKWKYFSPYLFWLLISSLPWAVRLYWIWFLKTIPKLISELPSKAQMWLWSRMPNCLWVNSTAQTNWVIQIVRNHKQIWFWCKNS